MTNSISHHVGSSWYLSQRGFYCLVLAAILLRIILMPFFAHIDLLSEARRIYFWDQQGIYFDDISRNTTAIFQLIFFKISSVFLPNKEMLLFHADMAHSTANPYEYFEFVSQPSIFRALFIIKLPFLCADLCTAWALHRYCGANQQSRVSVVVWLLNPITLFAFYIFGRFESIPILFCMLSILALQRKRLVLAAIMVALSVNAREIFIFLGPVFIAFALSPSAKAHHLISRLSGCAIVLLSLLIALQVLSLTGGGLDSFGREVTSIAAEGRVDHLFKFIVGSYVMFPLVYFFILMYSWNSPDSLQHKPALMFACVFFAFFCFSSHTAHYVSWMMIFPCIYLSKTSKLIKPVFILGITWVLFNLSITDKGVFTTWLASPWSIHFAGFPNFPEMYHALSLNGALDWLTYRRLCRTFYMGSVLYIVFIMLQYYCCKLKDNKV